MFTIFEGQNLAYSLSPSLMRLLAKNLQKQKSLLGSMCRKFKQKNRKKALKALEMKRQQFFTKIFQYRRKLPVFWALLRLCRFAMSKNIFLIFLPE
jgi:hypothetical protein